MIQLVYKLAMHTVVLILLILRTMIARRGYYGMYS
jgi:hypothetical protein